MSSSLLNSSEKQAGNMEISGHLDSLYFASDMLVALRISLLFPYLPSLLNCDVEEGVNKGVSLILAVFLPPLTCLLESIPVVLFYKIN